MKISLSPQRRDDRLTVSRSGDKLTVNGDVFDFSSLPDGATIPVGEVPCEWIVGPVDRVNGEIWLSLILPHGPTPPQEVAFPSPVMALADGPIELPREPEPETEEANNVGA